MRPLVQCPAWCACWPAGPFTDAEQRFLNGLEILVTLVPFSQKPCDYIRDNIVGVADTPQRRAHMLSVPIKLRGYYSMTSIAFLVCDKGVQGIPRAWDAWPLCPELAIVEYAQGWPSGSLIRFQHPGRASHGMSLLHCSRFRVSRDLPWLLQRAYPTCPCGSQTCCGGDTQGAMGTVGRWHRWWARRARRAWTACAAQPPPP